MDKYKQNLSEAIKNIKVADHILYITYPVIKDKRLLLKSLESVYTAIILMINSILYYEHLWKRIVLRNDSRDNLDIFINKCSANYGLEKSDVGDITNLISIVENHKKAQIEFKRNEKVIIMSENLSTTAIDPELIKNYISLARRLFEKARFMLNNEN